MNYSFFHQYLSQKGFTVYPHEMICGPEETIFEQNRFVDVVAKKNGKLYAFEYKSSGDQLIRAIKQVANYRMSFDYVIVVAEVPRFDISIHPKKGKRIQEILKQGAGLWTIKFRKARTLQQKEDLAMWMSIISRKAPIMAHQVSLYAHPKNGRLEDWADEWLWLFYSVIDRRCDASKFIKVKECLEGEGHLFQPLIIMNSIFDVGKDETIKKITDILRRNDLLLLNTHPRTIVETVQFFAQFDFNFAKMYNTFNMPNLVEGRDRLWLTFQKIYGAGPRIASQFIRGMVLKSAWQYPLTDNKFLEECRFNVDMAYRLGLLSDKSKFHEELGAFADRFLNGNRGIISHVLWYLRKKYCSEHNCADCPLFQHCFTYELEWQVDELIEPTLQRPNLTNREWVENKMLHSTSHVTTLKKPLSANQQRLTTFLKEGIKNDDTTDFN